MHAHWRGFLPKAEAAGAPCRSVAAVIDHPAGAPLGRTLASLAACPGIRRLIVLNRSGDALPVESVDLFAQDPEALGAQLAATVEDALLLIHSGVAVLREPFEAMVRALGSGPADGLLPAGRVLGRRETRVVPPLGGSAAFSLYEGATFTGALLVRRSALDAARAGRALDVESPFMGLADLCVTRNDRIWPYPELVVERPEEHDLEVKRALPARVAAYGEASATDRYYMLAAGYGAASGGRAVPYRRALALAAVEVGLWPLVRLASWGRRRLRRWRA